MKWKLLHVRIGSWYVHLQKEAAWFGLIIHPLTPKGNLSVFSLQRKKIEVGGIFSATQSIFKADSTFSECTGTPGLALTGDY